MVCFVKNVAQFYNDPTVRGRSIASGTSPLNERKRKCRRRAIKLADTGAVIKANSVISNSALSQIGLEKQKDH